MSQARVRETSEGESGMALLMGSSACSMRSRTFIAGFSWANEGWPPRARKRAPSTEPGVTAAAPKAKTTSTTVTKTTMVRINGIVQPECEKLSYLNLNNLANHEVTHGLQGDAGHQQGMANGIVKKRFDELRAEDGENGHHGWRHGHQQGHGEAALGGVDPNLALDLEALADDVGQVVENFGEVAAGFALEHDGGDEEFDIDQGHALGEVHKSVAHGHAELLLLIQFAEFAGERLRGFVGNHFQRGGESVTSADRAGQSVDGIGEKFFEFLEALLAAIGDKRVGKDGAYNKRSPTDGGILGIDDGRETGERSAEHAQHEEVTGAKLHAGLGESLLDGGNPGGAAQQSIECGNLAELFVAEESELLVGFALGNFVYGGEAVLDEAGSGIAFVEQGADDEGRDGNHDEDEKCNQQRHSRSSIGTP